MSLVSAAFLAFVAITAIIYYLVPGGARRWILLIASLAFCASCGFYSLVFVLLEAVTTFIGGLLCGPDKKKGLRNASAIITVILNLGILCAVRYYGVIGMFEESLNRHSILCSSSVTPLMSGGRRPLPRRTSSDIFFSRLISLTSRQVL